MTKHSFQLDSAKTFLALKLFFILIAVAVRFIQLGSIPAILNPDEASVAYNAYLLLQTGADETGKRWPLVLDAFGDQKVVGYALTVVASFALFGFSDFTVRLPVALAGIGLLFITDELLKHWKVRRIIRLFVLFTLTVQPIFIWYSRVGFEGTITLFLTVVLLRLVFTSAKKKTSLLEYLLIGSVVVASCFTYNVPLLTTPLFALCIPLWHGVKNYRKWLPLVVVIFIAWAISTSTMLSLTAQKSQITIFGDPAIYAVYGHYRESFTGVSRTLFGNRYVFYLKEILHNFIKSFDPGFITRNAYGHPWHALLGYGYLTMTVFVLGCFGLIIHLYKAVVAKTISYNQSLLLIYLMVMSLFPASITVNAPHATRTLLFFWCWSLFAAKACLWLSIFYSKKFGTSLSSLWRYLPYAVLGTLIFIPSLFYLKALFFVYPKNAKMQSAIFAGFDKAIAKVEKDYPDQSVAVVDDRGFHYILTAWYAKMPSALFRSSLVKQLPNAINFKYGEQVGRYHFIVHAADRKNEKVIVYWDESSLQWIVKE